MNLTNKQPKSHWHEYRVNCYEIPVLFYRKSKEIHFKYATQPCHKDNKCCIFKFSPSLSKEATIVEQFRNDVLENSCLFSVILKSHTVKK